VFGGNLIPSHSLLQETNRTWIVTRQEHRDQHDNIQTRREISGETMPCKILIFQNYEENNFVILNDNIQKLIEPFRRHIEFSSAGTK
jgi:hypothetical protein